MVAKRILFLLVVLGVLMLFIVIGLTVAVVFVSHLGTEVSISRKPTTSMPVLGIVFFLSNQGLDLRSYG